MPAAQNSVIQCIYYIAELKSKEELGTRQTEKQLQQIINGLHMTVAIMLENGGTYNRKRLIEKEDKGDAKHLKKHKANVYQLMAMLTPDPEFEFLEPIQEHINHFAVLTAADLPEKAILKKFD